MEQFVNGTLSRDQAMDSLRIGRSRLYELRASYLAARAVGAASSWMPGRSGGNHKGAPHWNCNNTGDIIVIKMGWEREDAQGVVKGATEAWTGETVARPFIVLPVTPAGQH